jgi:hypothetical protein
MIVISGTISSQRVEACGWEAFVYVHIVVITPTAHCSNASQLDAGRSFHRLEGEDIIQRFSKDLRNNSAPGWAVRRGGIPDCSGILFKNIVKR